MPGLTLPRELSGYRPQDVGLVTHAAVAIIAPRLRDLDRFSLPEHVLDVCGALVNGDNISRRRVLMLTAAGHASMYLRRLAPAPPWELLGAEYRLIKDGENSGRVDLAWQHSETGQVIFDELKTTNRAIHIINNVWAGQVRRYAQAGDALHGDKFLGVRLLPLGSLHLSVLARPGGDSFLLSPTVDEPVRTEHELHCSGHCRDCCDACPACDAQMALDDAQLAENEERS